MRALAERFYTGSDWRLQLVRYLSIGGFVTCVDIGSFAAFLWLRWPLWVVATVSYGLGVVTHFALNKYANFRAHDRPIAHQAGRYAIVAFVCWLTTLGIVKGAVALSLAPLLGKVAAVAFNIPLGFLGHRYVTFGERRAA